MTGRRPRGERGCPASVGGVRLTEFWERMRARFGAGYADSVARDQVIGKLGNRTVYQAFADGESAKDVWRAVCDHFDIPVPDRH